MDNILKNTIRTEIKSFMDSENTNNERKEDKKDKGPRKTEQRLGQLLSKIRAKSSESGSSQYSSRPSKKYKKLQLKYERYDNLINEFKVVRLKDGGGPRFVDVEQETPISFQEIKELAKNFYFDDNNCNNFSENVAECTIDLVAITGQNIDEDEDMWEYLKRKGLVISKTFSVLRSTYVDLSEDNLPAVFNNFNEFNESMNVESTPKRKLCHTCHCTYTGSECFICLQNQEYLESLEKDKEKTALELNLTTATELNDCFDNEMPNSSFEGNPIPDLPSVAELRQIRLNLFTTDVPECLTAEKEVKVNRHNIRKDLIKAFQDEIKVNEKITYTVIDSHGLSENGVGSGVSRDVYSMFWKDVADSYLVGADERVPFVRHDLYVSEWEAIGKILVKGFIDTGYFPIVISRSFMHYCLYGEVNNPDDLIDGFLRYLSQMERTVVQEALASKKSDIFTSEEFMDILDQFKCRTLVTSSNVNEVVIELARQELYQKPHIMATCWRTNFAPLITHLSTPESLVALYEKVEPTAKKLLALIVSDPANESERDALQYFKRFVRGLENMELKRLLQFLTGSELIIVNSLHIMFKKDVTEFSRRPIAHTCGPMLELPSTYNNFCELREEFTSILKKSTWEIDIV
ncbi:uncharacterized protein LOC130657280 [Hydractinia symbiolongicarpus]|uniref:uncharacterized protein LOC130657280 n=1 Tax=Hydractinia symbiolongicarpus TaxID=13093 RepID=UPI00254F2E2A|nr:uncharacterized protein LOC130657280 [Hydractinia symbiolongicarpus]